MIEIYTKEDCVWCRRAKAACADAGLEFKERKLDVHFTRDWLREHYPSATTYPVVVLDGFYIGGFQQLMESLDKPADPKQFLDEGEWNGR